MQSVTVLFRNRGESGPSHRFIFRWANTVSSVLDAQQMMTRGNLLFLVEVERNFYPYALLLQGSYKCWLRRTNTSARVYRSSFW